MRTCAQFHLLVMSGAGKRRAAASVLDYSALASSGGPPSPEQGPQLASRGARAPSAARQRKQPRSAQVMQQQLSQQVVNNHFTIVQAQPGGAAEPGASREALLRAVLPARAPVHHHRSRSEKARDDAWP